MAIWEYSRKLGRWLQSELFPSHRRSCWDHSPPQCSWVWHLAADLVVRPRHNSSRLMRYTQYGDLAAFGLAWTGSTSFGAIGLAVCRRLRRRGGRLYQPHGTFARSIVQLHVQAPRRPCARLTCSSSEFSTGKLIHPCAWGSTCGGPVRAARARPWRGSAHVISRRIAFRQSSGMHQRARGRPSPLPAAVQHQPLRQPSTETVQLLLLGSSHHKGPKC